MKKVQISIWDYRKKINRSNGAHKRLREIARKDAPNGKDVRYHTNIIRIQNAQFRVLSKKERREIYKRS